jgi:hypothetical protein
MLGLDLGKLVLLGDSAEVLLTTGISLKVNQSKQMQNFEVDCRR